MSSEIIILPIKEPWASMIVDGDKKFEFRCWAPKWTAGKQIWIVATGDAKKPREIIGMAYFGGPYRVVSAANPIYDGLALDKQESYKFSYEGSYSKIKGPEIRRWGGKLDDWALSMLDAHRFKKPIPLKLLGIDKAPQRYQYHMFEGDVWNVK